MFRDVYYIVAEDSTEEGFDSTSLMELKDTISIIKKKKFFKYSSALNWFKKFCEKNLINYTFNGDPINQLYLKEEFEKYMKKYDDDVS